MRTQKQVCTAGVFSPEVQSLAYEPLVPHQNHMMTTGIYAKPLRTLPFSKPIGTIEAIRHCQLRPTFGGVQQ
jgi:hypothetical protein